MAAADQLLAACRPLDIPVIYTRQINRTDGFGLPNHEVLDDHGQPVYYRDDAEAKEIIDDIAPTEFDAVIDKHRWSGFHATPLDLILRNLDIKHLIMGGFVTDGCLMTSVFDAYAHDYQVNLVKDGCAATNDGAHKAAILMMANWVYDIEIFNATECVHKLAGKDYTAWHSTAPDQMPFSGSTLDSVFDSLDSDQAG